MNFLCWFYTIVELSTCKTRGHIWTFQRYFDSLIPKASWLALKQLCWKSWSSVFIRWRSERLFRAFKLVSPPVMKRWGKINDWIYQIDILLPKMSRHYVGARHIFSTNEQQKESWQPKNWVAWSYPIMNSYEQTFVAAIHAQSCRGACHTLDILDFISIPKKMIVLILSNRCGMIGVGLWKLRKGKNELSKKKENF